MPKGLWEMMDTDTPPPHCHFNESGAAKSHSPMVCSIATGDLSTQRFNSPEVFISIPPCPSARDDGGGRQHTVISKGQMTETPHRPSVISTEAGQPPIGKPLIVQARGQLRLTWKLYAESPQSGEISLPHGTQNIGAGDLSALRFHSPRGFMSHTGTFPRSR